MSPQLPSGNNTVSVSLLSGGQISISASLFITPVLPGHEALDVPAFSFFIEHKSPTATRRVVFDLGLRKDFEGASPATQNFAQTVDVKITVDKDVATQLKDGGIDLGSVEAIIWSHAHFDHVGDSSTFPNSTGIVVGAGTLAHFTPTYPTNPESTLVATDFGDHAVTEIDFEKSTLTIGGFRSFDYFGDGSFYLLDVPGHTTGHMGALARVTPTSFVFMGGDTCHHPGQFRPSINLASRFPCPGSILEQHALSQEHFAAGLGSQEPLLQLQTTSGYDDHATAVLSVKSMADGFDASPDVLVIIAHDSSLDAKMFPQTLNGWKEEGVKERNLWVFADKNNAAFRFASETSA